MILPADIARLAAEKLPACTRDAARVVVPVQVEGCMFRVTFVARFVDGAPRWHAHDVEPQP